MKKWWREFRLALLSFSLNARTIQGQAALSIGYSPRPLHQIHTGPAKDSDNTMTVLVKFCYQLFYKITLTHDTAHQNVFEFPMISNNHKLFVFFCQLCTASICCIKILLHLGIITTSSCLIPKKTLQLQNEINLMALYIMTK